MVSTCDQYRYILSTSSRWQEEGRRDENEGEREEGRRRERKEVLHQGLNFKPDLMVQACNPSY